MADRRGPSARRAVPLAVLLTAVAALLAVVLPTPAASSTSGSSRGGSTAALPAGSATGVIPDDIAARFLARRPVVAPVTVVDVRGAPNDQLLLATTMQGIVNRSQARIYLWGNDGRGGALDALWLQRYLDAGLVTVEATVGLATALDNFAGELAGYVVADTAEPYTVNAATTVAAALGGVVALPGQVAGLAARGLPQLDDLRGRWSDASSAYEDVAATYRDQLGLPAMAIQQPTLHSSRDFYVQQGLLVTYARPLDDAYDTVYGILSTLPTRHPVYGYVSDDGLQEVLAVGRLAQQGRYLVPTDTTNNISFHVAVGADAPRATAPQHSTPDVEACTTDEVNVVLAFSDGDNIRIPQSNYARPVAWDSPDRGRLPLGWSIGPPTAVLLPGIWDHYATTASPLDELVSIMGIGYTFAALLPDPDDYYRAGFALDTVLGLSSAWSLDVLLGEPDAAGWAPLVDAVELTGAPTTGVLLNYTNFGGSPWFHTPQGMAALNSQSRFYEDGIDELAAQIDALVDATPDERPLVAFFSVTAWHISVQDLVTVLGPLEGDGVRFLTPAEAFACLPAFVPPGPPPGPAPVPPPGPEVAVPVTASPAFTA